VYHCLLWTACAMLVSVDDYNHLIDHLYATVEAVFGESLHVVSWNVSSNYVLTVDNFGRVI
jgi:hypothetical protein